MERSSYIQQIKQSFETQPAVAILGPRQCGKTTLARMYTKNSEKVTFFDLEDPRDVESLQNPMLALEHLEGLIIIDEIQRAPEIFPILRVLIDAPNSKQKFLILGSASRDLIAQSSETLAGRIGYIELTPFSLSEAGDSQKLWLRGGYPRAFLAPNQNTAAAWVKSYIKTYLERDIPNLGFRVPAATLRRFWLMLAHYHTNQFNASEIGVSLGVSHTAIKNYLGILSGTFMVRELKPWFEDNLKKRQVKTPKIYFRDSGIFNTLTGIHSESDLRTTPKLGSAWEGFALEEVTRFHQADEDSCYYWRTHGGSELDLLINDFGKKLGFEFKFSDAPKLTTSMKTALEDLKLNQLTVICPGNAEYALTNKIRVIGLEKYILGKK